MASRTGRFGWIAPLAGTVQVVSLAFLGLGLIVTVAFTVAATLDFPTWAWMLGIPAAQVAQVPRWIIPIAGVLCLLAEGVLAGWVVLVCGLAHVMVSNESGVATAAGRLGRVESILENQLESLRKLADLASLSDQARALIFRERELEAFREVIQADLMKQDYQTAERLIQELEQRFGYVEEAQRLRGQIQANRKASTEEKIDTAIRRIQEVLGRQDWAQALRESQRLMRMFPQNEKVASLPERIEAARAKHKRSLLQSYGEAVRKNDIDQSITLLHELDRYLTPQEAAALQESARGVFRAKLHNLGVQFAISVTEKQWADAVATGEEIVREFPNSRMAQEVQEKMDHLRSRAQGAGS